MQIDLNGYPDLLTIPEVADILRVDRSYVYRIIRQGRIAALRPTPHKTRVLKRDLLAFLTQTSVDNSYKAQADTLLAC